MSANWNAVSSAQQQQFLQMTGLGQLPELGALTPGEWGVLSGIVGEEAVASLRDGAMPGDTLADPALPPPSEDCGDWSAILAKVAEMRAKLGEAQSRLASESIKGHKDDMKAANDEDIKKIQESIEKLEEASKSGRLGKIFSWIGAIAAVIVAAVATVVTAGAAAPMLAIACVGLGMMVLQETGAMDKILEFMADNPALALLLGPAGAVLYGLLEGGVIDKDEFKMAIQITIAVTLMVASFASGGSGALSSLSGMGKLLTQIGNIVNAGMAVAKGVTDIEAAGYRKDAADIQAEQKEIQAWLAKMNSMLEEEMDRLQEILNKLNSGMADVSDMLSGITQTSRSIVANMGV